MDISIDVLRHTISSDDAGTVGNMATPLMYNEFVLGLAKKKLKNLMDNKAQDIEILKWKAEIYFLGRKIKRLEDV